MKGKDYGDKAKSSNRIRQPLIGKDVLIPRCERKTPYEFVAYSRHFYFVIITFYHSIAVKIFSERELWHLLVKLFIQSHKAVCGYL